MQTRISQAAIQDILSRTDIIELVQSRVNITKKGKNHSSRCPFHEEKTPSFTVSSEKQFYYCFGCGAHGNAINFLMAYDRMEFIDALTYLAERAGIDINPDTLQSEDPQRSQLYPLMERVARYYVRALRKNTHAIAYLKSRGLDGNTAKTFGIGYAPEGWDNILQHIVKNPYETQQLVDAGMLIQKEGGRVYDRFRHRILFPIRDTRGRVIAFGGRSLGDDMPKYLNSPETPIFHKSQELYGLYEARQQHRDLKRILIVEGYMDVVSLHQHGITYAVATLGTATNPKHVQKLLRYTQEVVFCFDGDRAGRQAAWKALETNLPILREGIQIRFLFLPDGEDPDTLIQHLGKVAFEQKIQEAASLSSVFFDTLSTQIPLTSLDAKAQFVKRATQLIDTMPKGIFQQLMLDQLAEHCALSAEAVSRFTELSTPPTPTKTKKSRLLPPTQLATALLLQNPNLALSFTQFDALSNAPLPGVRFLTALIKHLQQHPNLTTGSLISLWEGKAEQQRIAELAAHPLPIPDEGIEAEWLGALSRLLEHHAHQRRQKLVDKAKASGLSAAEKQEFQALLAEKSDGTVE